MDLNLIGIKTPQGIYIADYRQDATWNQYGNLTRYIINGNNPKPTFDNNWFLIESEPKTITFPVSPDRVNYRYELKNPELASEFIPLTLTKEEVIVDDEGDWLNGNYSELKPLYQSKWDEIPQPDKIVEFTYTQILETDNLKDFKETDWETYRSNWKEHQFILSIDKLQYQVIDKIRFPPIYYRTNCPVLLSSEDFYSIIRMHIVKNINSAVAWVDTNYDFCFSVKKRIRLNDPKIIKEEQLKSNGRRYKKPVFNTRVINYAGDVVVFSMTHKKEGYQGYPVLPDVQAANLEELQNKVDTILAKLIEEINTPLRLCPVCNGSGVEHKVDSVDINKLING